MRKFGPIFSKVIAALGLLGTVFCALAIGCVWLLESRLARVNEDVFKSINIGLTHVQSRTLAAQRRVQESTIRTDDLQLRVKELVAVEASERLASTLEIDKRIERLDLGLEQVEMYLAASEGSIRGIRQALSMGDSLGAPLDLGLVDALLTSLETMQKELGLADHAIDEIRQRKFNMGGAENFELHFKEVVQLVSIVAAKLGHLDARLNGLHRKLVRVQADAKVAQLKTHSWIKNAAIIATLAVVWMMAGQIALIGAFGQKTVFGAKPRL